MCLHSVMFELELIRCSENVEPNKDEASSALTELSRRGSQGARSSILLKGQMRFLKDIKAIIFLCSPL